MKRVLALILAALLCGMMGVPAMAEEQQIKRNLIGDGSGVTLKMTFQGEEFSKEPLEAVLSDFFKETGISVELLYVPSEGGWAGYFGKIQTMIASGDVPDMIRIAIEGFRVFQEGGMLEPLNDYAQKYPDFAALVSDQHPNLAAPFTVDGQVYGYTFDWNNVVVHFNLDVLQERGLALPPAEWSRDDFLEYAKQLTFTRDDGTQVYGFMIPDYFFAFSAWLFNAGGSVLSEDWTKCTLDSPEAIELVQFFQDCVHTYKVAPQPPVKEASFMAGQVAMGCWGRWPLKAYKESGFDAVDIQYLPTIKTNQVIFGSGIFPVLTASSHKDEAYKLACWLSSPAAQAKILEISHIPSSQQVMDEVVRTATFPGNSAIYADSADISKAVESPAQYNEIQAAFDRYFKLVMANEMDAESAMKAATEEIDLILQGF